MRPVSAPGAGIPVRASNSFVGSNDAAPAIPNHRRTSRREVPPANQCSVARLRSAPIVTNLPSAPRCVIGPPPHPIAITSLLQDERQSTPRRSRKQCESNPVCFLPEEKDKRVHLRRMPVEDGFE